MRLVPWFILVGTFAAADACPLAAQAISPPVVGSRVRVESCAEAADGQREVRFGQLAWHDDSALVLTGRDGREAIPMARVLQGQLNSKRSRELEGVGLLAGIAAGVYSLRFLIAGKDIGGGVIVAIPVAAMVGGVTGFFIGGQLSGEEEWSPLALPPGHGSACRG